MYAKQVIAVFLLTLIFFAVVLSGLIYIDHESRKTEFGENIPLIAFENDAHRVSMHIFGSICYMDTLWIEKAYEKIESFLNEIEIKQYTMIKI